MASNARCLLYLLAFFSLISACHVQAQDALLVVDKGISILNGLNKLFSKKKHKMTDITPRGLHFDMINDESYCQLLEENKLSDATKMVTEIIEDEFEDGVEKKKSRVLRGLKYPKKVGDMKISNFQFEKGKGGSTIFGFIATKKREKTFDLAICLETMKFKLAPRRILNEVKEKSLFSSSTSQYITFEEASLSQEEKEELEAYLFSRSIKRFVREFRYEIDFNNKDEAMISYCEADEADGC